MERIIGWILLRGHQPIRLCRMKNYKLFPSTSQTKVTILAKTPTPKTDRSPPKSANRSKPSQPN
jgi:hypothetical protein